MLWKLARVLNSFIFVFISTHDVLLQGIQVLYHWKDDIFKDAALH